MRLVISNNGKIVELYHGENEPAHLAAMLRSMSDRTDNKMLLTTFHISQRYELVLISEQFSQVMKAVYGIEVELIPGSLFTCPDIPAERQLETEVAINSAIFICYHYKTGEKVVAVGMIMDGALTRMGLKAQDYKRCCLRSVTTKRHLYINLSPSEIPRMVSAAWTDNPMAVNYDQGGVEYGVKPGHGICFCRDTNTYVTVFPEAEY